MVRRVQSDPRGTTGVPQAGRPSLFRCLRSGLGGDSGGKTSFGPVVGRRERVLNNHRELLAVWRVLVFFQEDLRARQVGLFCDNVTAVSYLRMLGGTRFPSLNAVAQIILRFCESQDTTLLPQVSPGALYVFADALSRSNQVLGAEWTLCPVVFRELQKRWSISIDLFATHLNHQLPNFFFPVFDPAAIGRIVCCTVGTVGKYLRSHCSRWCSRF